jgi:ATP phosphoribosyltransferase
MARVAEGLTFALPKGRILKQAVPLLRAAGLELSSIFERSGDRRLMLDLPGGHRVLLVKPTDVPTYVEYGIADIGIAGRDTLEEQCRDLYEPVDLGIGKCRMAVAELVHRPARLQRGMALRVATKYPRVAARHYRRKGIQPEIIPLYGSIELAPMTGLADQIVDLVESGETLRQNQLVEVETVFEVSSRLVVHPASLKLKQGAVTDVIDAIAWALGGKESKRKVASR